MIVSVRTAITANTLATTGVFLLSIASTAPVIMLNAGGNLPGYIAVPLCFLVLAAMVYVLYPIAAMRRFIWAFMHVDDVYELEKAINSFAAYAPRKLQKKHPEAFTEIMARFENYEFIDDPHVPPDVSIYNRKFYQSWYFIFGSCLTLCLRVLFICFPDRSIGVPLVILLCIISGLTVHEFYKISDRSPQMTLNEKGILSADKFIGWEDVQGYKVIQDEASYLEIALHETRTDIDLDYLNIGKMQLNHVMHVYQQRHLKAHSHRKL